MTANPPQHPLDRAFSMSIGGDHQAALALALQVLDGIPQNPPALFIAARALGSLNEVAKANRAFEIAIGRAIRSGNFPLAVAGYCELRQAGVEADHHLADIANIFGKGSQHLSDRRAPPELYPSTQPGDGYKQRDQELLALVDPVLEKCEQALAKDAEQPLSVPAQVPFSSLAADALLALIDAFEVLGVETDQVLIEEGTPGSEAYILARGELQVQRRAREPDSPSITLARLGAGALFGEMSLLSRSPRAASVVACRPSVVLKIEKEALDRVAEAQPEVARVLAQFTRRRMIDNLVRTSSILSAVRASKRSALLERFVTKTFEAGDNVITQGEESSGLYLVASGLLSVIHRAEGDTLAISKLGPGEVVGEVALVLRRPSTADVIAEHPTVTLHLPREQFLDLIKAHPEVLAELYELAVKRDEETRSLVAQEATDVDEFVLL